MADDDKLTRAEFHDFVEKSCAPHLRDWNHWVAEEQAVHAKVDRVHLAMFGNGNGEVGMAKQVGSLERTAHANKENIDKLTLSMFGCDKRKIPGMVNTVDEGSRVLARMNHWLDGLRLLWIGLVALAGGGITMITLFRLLDS